MTLGEYLSKNHGPFDYVNHDCSRWLSKWIKISRGFCPLETVGMAYRDKRDASLLIGREGDLLTLWRNGLDKLGFATVNTPKVGDIAILELPTDDGVNQTCGIWTGFRWASVHPSGTMFGFGTPLMIWSI